MVAVSCLSALLTGCRQTAGEVSVIEENPATEHIIETYPAETYLPLIPAESQMVYYLDGHGTMDAGELSKFTSDLAEMNFVWNVCDFESIPADADMLILNSPTEDITSEEMKRFDSFLDDGGRILFLLPANDSPVRYNHIEQILEKFCIIMDYDCITETEGYRMNDDTAEWVMLDYLSRPSTMSMYLESTLDGTPFVRHARSFQISGGTHFQELRVDALLRTADTAVGTPFGGEFDDPLSYENQPLPVMLYSYDDTRNTCAVVVVGANSFLTDSEYMSPSSQTMTEWIYTILNWFSL